MITKAERQMLERLEKERGVSFWKRANNFILRRTWFCILVWLVLYFVITLVLMIMGESLLK